MNIGMAMLCAEWWGFEIHALLAGLKGTVALGAQVSIIHPCVDQC